MIDWGFTGYVADSPSGYYTSVCLNGHARVDKELFDKTVYCEKCGSALIQRCLSCNEIIYFHDPEDNVTIGAYAPKYCKHCGKPYPWTEAALVATKSCIEEDEALSDEDKNKLIEVLPDMISETPKTGLAASRAKRALKSMSKFAADGLRDFAIAFGCAVLKDQLGLNK